MAGDDDVVAHEATPHPSPAPNRPGAGESDASAADSELAENLGIDGVADPDEAAGPAPRPADPSRVQPPDASSPASGGGPDGSPTGRRAKREKKRKRAKAPWWELPLLIAVAVAVAVLIKTFLIQPFYIPSQSMEPTLHGCPTCSGDRILVYKPIYDLRDPHPGDIIVFRAPSDVWFDNEPTPASPSNPIVRGVRWVGQFIGVVPPDEHDLVKRVIAVGGQTVQGLANGQIQVSDDGAAGPWRTLSEPYISAPLSGQDAIFGPVTVPKGRLWVMGDNRPDSADSRYHFEYDYKGDAVASTVPISDVIGKAIVIAWPPSRWRTLGTPATFTHAAAGAMPVLGAVAIVLPVFALRRRRRSR